MISRHIPIKVHYDNYARLAKYLARLDEYADNKDMPYMHWCEGCIGGDDYREGIREVQDTQALNTRIQSNPTYHLVISFHPEDRKKLTPEILQDIERRFADALGLSEHQRHCVVHNDTDNLHMQIAYNLIHPITLTKNCHSYDYIKRDVLCRQLEKEFCLTIDKGMEQKKLEKANELASGIELKQGIESFDTYVKSHKEEILQKVKAAQSWQDIHEIFALYGLKITLQNAGLAIKNRHANHGMRASALDRSLSKMRLVDRFGPYSIPAPIQVQEICKYKRRPIHRSPLKQALWADYEREITANAAALEKVKARQKTCIEAVRAKWAKKRTELEALNIHKHNRRNLLQRARAEERAEIAALRATHQKDQSAHYRHSWNEFLRKQAENGDEAALTVLRSRTQAVAQETPPDGQNPYETLLERKANLARQRARVQESPYLSYKGKRKLQAILRMEEVIQEWQARNGTLAQVISIPYRISDKGIIEFCLCTGGKILDRGQEILFSAEDEETKKIALLYAQKKWGKHFSLVDEKIIFHKAHENSLSHEPAERKTGKGISR